MTAPFEPAYMKLYRSGELESRARDASGLLRACTVCPRRCGINRLASPHLAGCRMGSLATIASYGPHHGEEYPLRGTRGSGTIFFSGCNLQCVYCQNHDISQHTRGHPASAERLAQIMLELQHEGCHNINLVSPTHVVPQILAALLVAAEAGLRLPLVYNTGGYDSLETLALLDGIVDVYMPDLKYANADVGERLSGVPDYPQRNQAAVREMHRQVGDLQTNHNGIARRGLLVRHLILPNQLAGTDTVLAFLAHEISTHTYLNLMDRYQPCYQVNHDPRFSELRRRITADEYRRALDRTQDLGFTRLDLVFGHYNEFFNKK